MINKSKTKNIDLYLASKSPRRRELLTQVGIRFDVLDVDIDETQKVNETAKDYVIRLAREKAVAGWNNEKPDHKPVLGSDTAVVIQGEILGKPENREDAIRMLNLLSGQTHQVMTAVALLKPFSNNVKNVQYELNSVINVSDVTFKVLSEQEIAQYVDSGEGVDKAGSYAIQGKAAAFITHLSGSYSGVMGLPLFETVKLLNKSAISTDF
jgi:septum formation protein